VRASAATLVALEPAQAPARALVQTVLVPVRAPGLALTQAVLAVLVPAWARASVPVLAVSVRALAPVSAESVPVSVLESAAAAVVPATRVEARGRPSRPVPQAFPGHPLTAGSLRSGRQCDRQGCRPAGGSRIETDPPGSSPGNPEKPVPDQPVTWAGPELPLRRDRPACTALRC